MDETQIKQFEELKATLSLINQKLDKISEDQFIIMSHLDSEELELRKRVEKIEQQLGTGTSI